MVLLGVSMFGFNWLLGWFLVRGHRELAAPVMAALAAATLTSIIGFTLAIATAAIAPMDACVFFGLPAAGVAIWCASVRNAEDSKRRFGRVRLRTSA